MGTFTLSLKSVVMNDAHATSEKGTRNVLFENLTLVLNKTSQDFTHI